MADRDIAGPRPASRRFRFSYLWAAVAVVALVVGVLAGFYVYRAQHADDAAVLAEATAKVGELQAALTASEDRNWMYYRTIAGLKTELEQARSTTSTTVPSPAGVRSSYSDGIYLVGRDILPGTYDGMVNGAVGYWARLKGTDGAIASISENAIPKGPFVLTIIEADKAVELRGVTITPR